MGPKNLRLLKLLVPLSTLVFLLYILYEYKQANNNVKLHKRFLKESEEEYKILTKRFDMLSRELKSAVQKTADIDKELRVEKEEHTQITKADNVFDSLGVTSEQKALLWQTSSQGTFWEGALLGRPLRIDRPASAEEAAIGYSDEEDVTEKRELERQCQTEGVRKDAENSQLLQGKRQLMEEKDVYKRERDRMSDQVQSLTQELSDQHAREIDHNQMLQDAHDTKISECSARESSLSSDLMTCKNDLRDTHMQHILCKEELLQARRLKVGQGLEIEQLHQQISQYKHDKQQEPEPNLGKPRGYNYQPGQSQEAGHHRVANSNLLAQQLPRQQVRSLPDLQSPGVGHVQDLRNDPPQSHMDDNQKRMIYQNLREKVKMGEHLTDKQKHAYDLLSSHFTDEMEVGDAGRAGQFQVKKSLADRRKSVKNMQGEPHSIPVQKLKSEMKSDQSPHARVLPAPGNKNNDQEEVEDFLEGQQHLKESQRGVAGAPDDSPDDNDNGRELRRGKELPKAAKRDQEKGHADRGLPRPVPEGGHAENNNMPHPPMEVEPDNPDADGPVPAGKVGGNEDDEDMDGDYKAERRGERNEGKQPVHQGAQFEHEHLDEDDGRNAYLNDHRMFEEERLRQLRKEPRKGVLIERQAQVQEMEKQVLEMLNNKHRDMI